MTWYQKLVRCIEVAGTGNVAELLRSTVDTGLFSLAPKSNGLDASISEDVSDWFHTRFKPWFTKITLGLGAATSREDLVSGTYITHLNSAITALHVARAYYAKQADNEFVSSLEHVARYQAQFCEELAEALQVVYIKALAAHGLEPVIGSTITEASSYRGVMPEGFNWPGPIEAFHQIIKDVVQEGQQQQQQQEEQKVKIPQYLPWVFTAAFGLIAWSAAAKKQ